MGIRSYQTWVLVRIVVYPEWYPTGGVLYQNSTDVLKPGLKGRCTAVRYRSIPERYGPDISPPWTGPVQHGYADTWITGDIGHGPI